MSDDDSPTLSRKRSYGGNDEARRRSEDDGDDRFSKRRGPYSSDDEKTEIRLLIPSKDAGVVIGKGGDNIKRLRQDLKAGITISDSRTPERVLVMTGDLDALSGVLLQVFSGLDEKYHQSGSRSTTAKMLIHQSQAGCVIGKAGGKLKEFRADHGVDIKVYSSCCPRSTDRTLQVVGSGQSVTDCLIAVCSLLKTWPPKGPSQPYDPSNWDESILHEYGGYTDDERGGGGGGGARRYGGRDGGERSYRGGGGGRGGDRRGDSPSDNRRGFGGGGGRDRGRDDRGGSMGGGGRSFGGGGGEQTTQQVSIPSNLAGVIIGKGGSRIKQIRMESGADVNLSEAEGPEDRIITISGTADQIQNAQYMLQTSVKQHLARNA